MVVDGLILVILTLIFVTGQVVAHRGIKKVTNSYFFGAIIGAFGFAGLVAFRFAADGSRYAHAVITDPSSMGDSIIISKALLLDVCPFAALAMCLLLVVDPSRKIARSLAPIALIGGAITVASVAFDESVGASLTAEFIFFGISDGMKCYFIMHFLQVVLAVGVMLNTPRNGGKGTLLTLIITVSYYSYVGIVMAITGVAGNVSGLSINDGTVGEYHFVAEIFHIPPQVCQIIGIPILGLVGCGIISIKDYVFDKGGFRYGNAYSGKGYQGYDYNIFVKQRIL